MSLLDYARDEFSQNGEDGIVARVFEVIGDGDRRCCEFGAWDGLHLSNTRALIQRGWGGVLIEADDERFQALARTYADRGDVRCLHARVGEDVPLSELAGDRRLDFLSIDIDGLDYEAFRDARVGSRLVCVEVNAGHDPDARVLLPSGVAAGNIGQPLGAFAALATTLGYRLIGYTGNAFFLHEEERHESDLPTLSPEAAYLDFLGHLDIEAREWLMLVNEGRVGPHHRFRNPHLVASGLGISIRRAVMLRLRARRWG